MRTGDKNIKLIYTSDWLLVWKDPLKIVSVQGQLCHHVRSNGHSNIEPDNWRFSVDHTISMISITTPVHCNSHFQLLRDNFNKSFGSPPTQCPPQLMLKVLSLLHFLSLLQGKGKKLLLYSSRGHKKKNMYCVIPKLGRDNITTLAEGRK